MISVLTSVDMMPWQTIYSQCYYNAAEGGALDRMSAGLYRHDAEHACVDDAMCSTGAFSNAFKAFGDIPCIGESRSSSSGDEWVGGWNESVKNMIAESEGPFGLKMTISELDDKCSRSCLSRTYCRNPLDKCHPWCEDFTEGFTNFRVFCPADPTSDTQHPIDFCKKDKSRREELIKQGKSHDEAEEEASSVCFSTYSDDIGTFHKFSEKANMQLQNLLVTIEMFLAALGHRKVFSYRDFKTGNKKTMAAGLRDMVPTEVLRDVQNLTTKQALKQVKTLEEVGGQAVEAAAGVVGKATETAAGVVGKATETAAGVVGKATETAAGVVDKASSALS